MRKMRDSGVEWIGEIPVDWKLSKIKHHFSISSGTTPKSDEPQYWDGDIVWITPADFKTDDVFVSKGHRNLSQEGYRVSSLQLVPAGSIIFSKRAPIGQVVINAIDLCTNQGCLTAVLNDDSNVRFYRYVMSIATEEFELAGSGTTFKEISATRFENILLPLTSKQEQTKCADYLDSKCSKIDVIIEKQQAIIEKLKEYKFSIINEAVTQGINPDVNMKQSGYKWIGNIPKHWNMVYAKQLFSQRKDRAFEDDEQLTASQKYGIISQKEFMDIEGRQVMQVLKGEEILKHVEKGDFVISMRSFQGGLEYSEVSGKISSAYVMLIPNRDKVYDRYYKWLFKSKKYISALQGTSNLIRDGQALRFSNFVQVYLPSLDLDEQKQIADYLDDICPKIDNEIEKREKLLGKVMEYKKSLIYEVVTGKKEV